VDTSSHIRLDYKREINTTTTVMNQVSNTTVYRNALATLVYPIVDSGVTITSHTHWVEFDRLGQNK